MLRASHSESDYCDVQVGRRTVLTSWYLWMWLCGRGAVMNIHELAFPYALVLSGVGLVFLAALGV